MKNEVKMFDLPHGWKRINETYQLKNDQGLDFVTNILSPSGRVVTVFKAQPLLGLPSFDKMINDYGEITVLLKLKKKFNIKMKEKTFPIYIIEGADGTIFAQAFFDTENKDVFSLLTCLETAGKNFKEYAQNNPVLNEIVSLLRVAK